MTEKFSRPATIEDVKILIRSFNQENVEYLLIGGYALYAHGYNRATIDIKADRLVIERALEKRRLDGDL
ncbi:MAG: hypothetical protein HY922_13910 [Elusimicrobia bacterium]|nr:hypothetical protein [Elusimicrobiota bacterium]